MSQPELNQRNLTLHRFPRMQGESPLQAWDAADEYLLQQTLPPPEQGALLVFNDSFGALACMLNRPLYSISDSWISQQAVRQNLRDNGLNEDRVVLLDSLAPLPATPAGVLIKIPRSLALLEHQLRQLRALCDGATCVQLQRHVRPADNMHWLVQRL